MNVENMSNERGVGESRQVCGKHQQLLFKTKCRAIAKNRLRQVHPLYQILKKRQNC